MASKNGSTAVMTLAEQQVSNGGEMALDTMRPYVMSISIEGIAPLLFHSWNIESVEAKAASAKNSAAKKQDDVESYAYRTRDGYLGVPGANFTAALIVAAKSMPDPRSPRKSAMDLCRASIVPLSTVAPFEPQTKTWDYLDRRRVTVQRAGVTRTRPAMQEGWRLTFDLLINAPEYWTPASVVRLANEAGKLVGLCDFRPSHGRFTVTGYAVQSDE